MVREVTRGQQGQATQGQRVLLHRALEKDRPVGTRRWRGSLRGWGVTTCRQSAMTAFALSVLSAYHLLPLPLQWLTLGKKTKTPQPFSNPSQISTDRDTGLNPQLLQMDPGHMGWSDTPAQLSAGKEAQKRFGGLKDILLPCPFGWAIS
ncbi:hypothetical protein H8958_018706 [Nasalis larvatus]